MLKFIVVVTFFVSAIACADTTQVIESIVRVKIASPMGGFTDCVGILVDESTIITVAHCGMNRLSYVEIRSGNQSAATVYSIRAYSTPDFRRQLVNANDLAILKLTSPVIGYRKMVFLPWELNVSQDELFSASPVHVVSGYRRKNFVMFERDWKNKNFSSTEFSLVQDQLLRLCHTDSGGPALVRWNDKWILIGVLSHFNYGASEKTDDPCSLDLIYTALPQFESWFQSIDWQKQYQRQMLWYEQIKSWLQ